MPVASKKTFLGYLISCVIIVILIFNQFCVYGQSDENYFELKKISEDVYAYTTYKDYKGKPFPANGIYILTSEGIVLIDSPWDTTEISRFEKALKTKHNQDIVLCIATHSHEDRAGGFSYFNNKKVSTYSIQLTDRILMEESLERPNNVFSGDTTFVVGDKKIEVFYAGPGHTTDNVVIWVPEDKVLFGGCMVKGINSTNLGYIEEANLTEWPVSLNKVLKKYPSMEFAISGHQEWEGIKAIDHTLKLLKTHQEK